MDYSKYFPILEYYRKFVQPINSSRYKIKNDRMMVCPLHNDHDPSMGIMENGKYGEIFHCFGCGAWGNIIKLHIGVMKRLRGIIFSHDEAIKDLCRIFSIDYDKLPKEEDINVEDKELLQEIALEEVIEKFDVSDYRNLFLEGKRKKKNIVYFNTLTMMMISELKGM